MERLDQLHRSALHSGKLGLMFENVIGRSTQYAEWKLGDIQVGTVLESRSINL
jgi:hypothetical protein